MFKISSKPSIASAPIHAVRLAHKLASKDLVIATAWYQAFNSECIRRKHGKITSYGAGLGVHLQYPLRDLHAQLPITFHEEVKKLDQVKRELITISCEKYSSAAQNEEEAWEMVTTLVDVIATCFLPPSCRKGKLKEVKTRVQELLAQKEAVPKERSDEKEDLKRQHFLQGINAGHAKRREKWLGGKSYSTGNG